MIQEKTVLAFPHPKVSSLEEIRYFNRVDLSGAIAESGIVWGSSPHFKASDEHGIPLSSEFIGADDLIGLRDHDEQDSFSTFLEQKASQWFHRQIVYKFSSSVRKQNKLMTYKSQTVIRITTFMATIIACLLPIISISVLYLLKSMKGRLWAIAGFNILLSVCLGIFTTAKRVEIFGVTAA